MTDPVHVATVEVTEGADGTWLAEVYYDEEVFSGYGTSSAEAIWDVLNTWQGVLKPAEKEGT